MPTVDVIIGALDRTAIAFGASPGTYVPSSPQEQPIVPSPPIEENIA